MNSWSESWLSIKMNLETLKPMRSNDNREESKTSSRFLSCVEIDS